MARSKDEIEQELAFRVGFPLEKVSEVLNCLASLAYEEAQEGFSVRGFGEFRLVEAQGRKGINPFTGKSVFLKALPDIQFTPDFNALQRFRGRRRKPTAFSSTTEEPRPLPEVSLIADSEDWKVATGGVGGVTNSKLGRAAEWIQADETPICCGEPSQFC
ncbi:MAG: HU family DNA-binding protein [Planctomycetaceae bacterium]|nr:HU family DNA-binding protein [Planctomycetaceae bacterium]